MHKPLLKTSHRKPKPKSQRVTKAKGDASRVPPPKKKRSR